PEDRRQPVGHGDGHGDQLDHRQHVGDRQPGGRQHVRGDRVAHHGHGGGRHGGHRGGPGRPWPRGHRLPPRPPPHHPPRARGGDGQAALPANPTLTNGTGMFTFTLKTAGSRSVTATDTVTASITGSQAGITVNPAAASTLAVAGFPTTVTAGTAGSITVTAKDAYGNTATGYTGTISFSSSDKQAVLPRKYTFFSPDAAAHTVSNGGTSKN